MHAIKERTEEHHNINKIVGTNLRFIRNCKRITLMGLAEVMQIRFNRYRNTKKELTECQLIGYGKLAIS